MAELADAHGSGPCESNFMRVQVPFPALGPAGSARPTFKYAEVSELADEQD